MYLSSVPSDPFNIKTFTSRYNLISSAYNDPAITSSVIRFFSSPLFLPLNVRFADGMYNLTTPLPPQGSNKISILPPSHSCPYRTFSRRPESQFTTNHPPFHVQ